MEVAPILIGRTLHAMIGDVNLFLSNVEKDGNNGNKRLCAVSDK